VPIGFSDHSAAETCRSNGFGSQYFESMLFWQTTFGPDAKHH
jgi:hypothetical protein